ALNVAALCRCGLRNGPCGIHHGDEPWPAGVYRRRCGLSRWKCSARQAGAVRFVMAAGVTPVAEVGTMDSAGCTRSDKTLFAREATPPAVSADTQPCAMVGSV
ncbi:MAG: hypothetical protein ACKON9_09365, partial [Planctomycetaceae bacterium]